MAPHDIMSFAEGDLISKVHVQNPVFDYVPPDLIKLFISNMWGSLSLSLHIYLSMYLSIYPSNSHIYTYIHYIHIYTYYIYIYIYILYNLSLSQRR